MNWGQWLRGGEPGGCEEIVWVETGNTEGRYQVLLVIVWCMDHSVYPDNRDNSQASQISRRGL